MEMNEDKNFCMNSFLMYRTIANRDKTFAKGILPKMVEINWERDGIHNSKELEASLKRQMEMITKEKDAAIALSGGIDSAILAKFMPKGSTAYTFQCVAPGIEVLDETPIAKRYAQECGLKHKVVKIYWEDFNVYAPHLMKQKGMPIHSIEVQIYKASLEAKKDGFEKFIFGESADVSYGGFSNLMSRDWLVGEFIERYSYVQPWKVLKEPSLITKPITDCEDDGYIDVHKFVSGFFLREGLGSYVNATRLADIDFFAPFSNTYLAIPIDYNRIRSGENKYLVREVFQNLYPNWDVPIKIPMPRPMNEWLKEWTGPTRPEFWPHCMEGMTGDQKWLVYILEKFLNLLDGKQI